ncbi:MAG TPA: hypothetical protein DEA22_02185, partial [Blastocatellia bacterium]|nr:hypothetical protein [Blastocatellia bacterium]
MFNPLFGANRMATTNTMLTFDGEQTLGTMLGGKVGLRVPPSQRSYRWKKEHIEALLNDIRENLDEDEYYVGSVIVVTSTKDKTFVFDGQQRLATTSILIAAIRDKFLELGEEKDARDTEEEFLFSEKRRTTDPVPHFILNTEDQTFFFDRAISRPTATDRRGARNRANTPANEKSTLPQSNKRIDQAAKIAADYVKKYVVAELPHDEAVDRLHKWLDFLRDSLRIILVKAGDDRTAFTMFETMNDRGLRLSAADLLKNRLYADAGNRQEEVIQKWTSMSAILESADSSEEVVMEYLRCYWIANNGHTRSKDLYDKIKAKVKTPSQAVNLAAKLEQSARDYAAIITSSHEKWSSRGATLRTKIETLRLLGITQLRPVLLAAINNFNNKEFDALVEACVSWSVRSLLGGVSSGNIEADYSRTALKITNREITKAS